MRFGKFLPKTSGRTGPENTIRDDIRAMLAIKGWYVMVTHGNMFQAGFPDLWCTHSRYGQRSIEVKLPGMKGSKFTPAQLDCFPKICANGSGVWVLTGATEEEYSHLFRAPNWYQYLSTWKDAFHV